MLLAVSSPPVQDSTAGGLKRVTLRFSEHRRELARDGRLRHSSQTATVNTACYVIPLSRHNATNSSANVGHEIKFVGRTSSTAEDNDAVHTACTRVSSSCSMQRSLITTTDTTHHKYLATLPYNSSLTACSADINVSQGSVATSARCGSSSSSSNFSLIITLSTAKLH